MAKKYKQVQPVMGEIRKRSIVGSWIYGVFSFLYLVSACYGLALAFFLGFTAQVHQDVLDSSSVKFYVLTLLYLGLSDLAIGVLLIMGNLPSVKQLTYRILGSLLVVTMLISLVFSWGAGTTVTWTVSVIPCIAAVFLCIPLFKPMDDPTLSFLRPISIVKEEHPTQAVP